MSDADLLREARESVRSIPKWAQRNSLITRLADALEERGAQRDKAWAIAKDVEKMCLVAEAERDRLQSTLESLVPVAIVGQRVQHCGEYTNLEIYRELQPLTKLYTGRENVIEAPLARPTATGTQEKCKTCGGKGYTSGLLDGGETWVLRCQTCTPDAATAREGSDE